MNRISTVDAAHGRWTAILLEAGFPASALRNQHGPCPLGCGGKTSWRFDDRGIGSWICSHCGAGDGFQALQRLKNCDFKRAADLVDQILGSGANLAKAPAREGPTPDQKRRWIKQVLAGAKPLSPGQPAWAYLEGRCGPLEGLTGSLRHHPALPYRRDAAERFPALLALLQHPDGTGCTVHRYYLTPEGRKAPVDAPRKMMPIPGGELHGAAVRTSPVCERIGIAEGLETALCAGKLFGLPVWAGISAAGLQGFEPPEGVQSVLICADNDPKCAGQSAAFALAKRLWSRGIAAEVRLPDLPGEDWADVYARERGCRAE